MSNKEIRNYDPGLLLDFYETKLRFRKKNKQKRKKEEMKDKLVKKQEKLLKKRKMKILSNLMDMGRRNRNYQNNRLL